jgi:hypothetical protein
MEYSCIQLNDLPDEILMIILKKLNNLEILYSLIGVNKRSNKIVHDTIFTHGFCLLMAHPVYINFKGACGRVPRIPHGSTPANLCTYVQKNGEKKISMLLEFYYSFTIHILSNSNTRIISWSFQNRRTTR